MLVLLAVTIPENGAVLELFGPPVVITCQIQQQIIDMPEMSLNTTWFIDRVPLLQANLDYDLNEDGTVLTIFGLGDAQSVEVSCAAADFPNNLLANFTGKSTCS